jgi:hypothetical protein
MKHLRQYASWGLAAVAVVLSPIVLIFALPVAIGAGVDVFTRVGEMPVAVALCLPLALVLLGRALARPSVHHVIAAARPHFGRPARQH